MARYDVASGETSVGIEMKYYQKPLTYGGFYYDYDSMFVASGGTANETTVNGGEFHLEGLANSTTLNRPGSGSTVGASASMYISSGGTANNTTVNGGVMYVSYGGIINDTLVNIGNLFVGGVANYTTTCSMHISSDGVANYTTLKGGEIHLEGLTYSTSINGNMYISFGGIANYTTLNSGRVEVSSGGIINNTTIDSGTVCISSGGILTGRTILSTTTSNSVVASAGAIIDFDISTITPNASVRFSNLDRIEGVPIYTLTVSSTQENGSYKLGFGTTFNQTITVQDVSGKKLGVLGMDEKIKVAQKEYALSIFANILTLSISGGDTNAPTITNIVPSTMELTDSVTVTANFADDVELSSKQYRIGTGEWNDYTTGVTIAENTTVYFKAIDAAGNEAEAYYVVTNILTVEVTNEPDNGKENDVLYDKKTGWHDGNISVLSTITGVGEINLDSPGSIDKARYHNMFGNDGTNVDTGDVARINVDDPAKLTFQIDSTAAGTFYVYEDGVDKKDNRKLITVGKVSVKAGKTATLTDVCLTADGKYYVAMTAKNVKKAGTEGLYNVSVTSSTFFVDADDGTNNTAAKAQTISVGRGTTAIVLDVNPMTASTVFDNFVGFGDAVDYAKLDLTSSAYMSFNVKADGASKFTIWKQDAKGNLSKVSTTSLVAKKGFTATTTAKFLDTSKYTYYVSMESTDARKGGSAYYNVEINNKFVFFDSADNGINNVLYDKKAKAFKFDANFLSNEIGAGTQSVLLDDGVETDEFENFVGYQDAVDYAKITLASNGNLSFTLKATGDATFTVYRKGEKKGKAVLETIQTTKLTLAKGASLAEMTTKLLSGLEAGEYYVSMAAKSTKATDKGSVFYNVMASFDVVNASALADVSGFDNKLNMQNGGLLA